MDKKRTVEKNRERIEIRTAYTSDDAAWLCGREKRKNLCCIGAIRKEVEADGKRTEEWHCYISSRKLSAEELLHHARMEWAVESMHWLFDVHYGEDYCRIACWNLIFCVRSWKIDFRDLYAGFYQKNTGEPFHFLTSGCIMYFRVRCLFYHK